MSGTVAIDTVRVEERERRIGVAAAEPGPTAECLLRDTPTADLGTAPPAPWPPRKLNDALADIGPMRPGGRVGREPWSRAKLPRADVSSTAPHANDDGVAIPDNSKAINEAASTRPVNAAGPGLGDLPPPPRPSRPTVMAATSAIPSDPTLENWGEFALAEDDATGADIVRALAEANLAVGSIATKPLAEVTPLDGDEPLERPPMIIERAIAEQEQRMASSPPTVLPASPLPGLAVGFTLSVMAGAALYLALASG